MMSRVLTWVAALWLLAWPAAAQEFSGLARPDPGVSMAEDSRWGGAQLTLGLSQGVPWRAYTLDDPARLVLDFQEVDWQGLDPAQFVQSDRITAVRFGPVRPGWSRLVADLAGPLAIDTAAMEVAPETGRAVLRVALGATDAEDFAARSGAPGDPRWAPPAADPPQPRSRDRDGRFLIVLDPGHGGIDPGAHRDGVTEKDLMLTFARELKETLLRAGGVDVVLTRDDDRFVSLERRVAIAQELEADLFLSLHADALAQGTAHGTAAYTLSDTASDEASAALAARHNRADLLAGVDLSGEDDVVANVLLDLARLDNGPRSQAVARGIMLGIRDAVGHIHKDPLRQAGFSVLKSANIPSVLLEVGFLSSPKDLERLVDPAWRQAMAEGIRDGIQAWRLTDEAAAGLRLR